MSGDDRGSPPIHTPGKRSAEDDMQHSGHPRGPGEGKQAAGTPTAPTGENQALVLRMADAGRAELEPVSYRQDSADRKRRRLLPPSAHAHRYYTRARMAVVPTPAPQGPDGTEESPQNAQSAPSAEPAETSTPEEASTRLAITSLTKVIEVMAKEIALLKRSSEINQRKTAESVEALRQEVRALARAQAASAAPAFGPALRAFQFQAHHRHTESTQDRGHGDGSQPVRTILTRPTQSKTATAKAADAISDKMDVDEQGLEESQHAPTQGTHEPHEQAPETPPASKSPQSRPARRRVRERGDIRRPPRRYQEQHRPLGRMQLRYGRGPKLARRSRQQLPCPRARQSPRACQSPRARQSPHPRQSPRPRQRRVGTWVLCERQHGQQQLQPSKTRQ